MTTISLASVKHSPGVTTAAVALAAAYGDGAVVVEADPLGGDIAARSGIPFEPGLLTLAASGRHLGTILDFGPHAQPLPSGGRVVVAPLDPDRAGAAVATTAPRLSAALGAELTILDCGRMFASSAARPAMRGADLVLMALEPTVTAVEHLRVRMRSLDRPILGRVAALLVGDRPYRPVEVEHALGIPVIGSIAIDPRGVGALYSGTTARRSLLVRSARSVLDAMSRLDFPAEALT